MGYRLDVPGFKSQQVKRFFCPLKHPDRSRRESNDSTLIYCRGQRKSRAIHSPPYNFMACTGTALRFTFYVNCKCTLIIHKRGLRRNTQVCELPYPNLRTTTYCISYPRPLMIRLAEVVGTNSGCIVSRICTGLYFGDKKATAKARTKNGLSTNITLTLECNLDKKCSLYVDVPCVYTR